TDVVAVDEATGFIVATKTPTTWHDPSLGVLDGIRKILRLVGGGEVAAVSHCEGLALVPTARISSSSSTPTSAGRALRSRSARVTRAREDVPMDRRRFLALPLAGAATRPGLAAAQAKRKMAMIMPGPIQDADFNAVGYLALQQVAKTYDLQV